MIIRVQNNEFRDENAVSRYPFTDTATLQTREYRHVLELNTFIDASIYPIGAVGYVYLGSVTVSGNTVTLGLRDSLNNEVATGSFITTEQPSVIYFYDASNRPAGILLAEPFKLLQFGTWQQETHTFASTATPFVAACVQLLPDVGLRGIAIESGELFTEDVYLVGENGVVLSLDGDDIRVDIVGDPLFLRNKCGNLEAFQPPRFFTTVNGCPPDTNGNVNITVGDHVALDTIIRIVQTTNGLEIKAIGAANE